MNWDSRKRQQHSPESSTTSSPRDSTIASRYIQGKTTTPFDWSHFLLAFTGFTARPTRHVHIRGRFKSHLDDVSHPEIPVNEALLRRTSALIVSAPRDIFLRTADAVHLTTAQEAGERDVWTSDRHMLAAATYFGLAGRSV
jgi:hypothetical protein